MIKIKTLLALLLLLGLCGCPSAAVGTRLQERTLVLPISGPDRAAAEALAGNLVTTLTRIGYDAIDVRLSHAASTLAKPESIRPDGEIEPGEIARVAQLLEASDAITVTMQEYVPWKPMRATLRLAWLDTRDGQCRRQESALSVDLNNPGEALAFNRFHNGGIPATPESHKTASAQLSPAAFNLYLAERAALELQRLQQISRSGLKLAKENVER
ncbi:MAG: hypothetical protein RL095_824 [Verrucomicrobiota bacterium]|jgi:hypothetical protein